MDHAGYEAALRAKLLEEAHEAQAASDGQLVSELADVLEVLRALGSVHDMDWEEVVSEASRKSAERGGFDHRIFLEYVEQLGDIKARAAWIGCELQGIIRKRQLPDRLSKHVADIGGCIGPRPGAKLFVGSD